MDANFVLLVEDDTDMRESLAILIRHYGCEVETAANGQEALDKLEEKGAPCLILLDLMMPVMDGWQFRAEILRQPELAKVPVALLSGIADIQSEARSLDAVAYLTKPVDLAKLYTVIQPCRRADA